ncbi:PREDICTED: maternal embryonic leucine zipper kinase-like isoform X2 [Vollenhovia emeryi]|nr:PREDICTED: maternal embryonic leucine zipper kinase-like isoform X2 [Vollenhovia emeryi]
MVMEYCSGGELFDHIVEKNKLSESDSRKFFRQIVSAVVYMHSLGYAHRDLKPENVLLDKDENLKLIDFGLCAKPKMGIQAHLYTSCGSPTYAAPELIMGRKYLGSEVDIWSMGVLLYALLCGFLPFDDNNLENLYKKILSGKYEEPYWLSNDSKTLIKSMLQINPAQRITIHELCRHPWVMGSSLKSISFVHRTEFEKDDEVLSTMSAICGGNSLDIWKKLRQSDRTDYRTATYLLLLDRKLRGLSLKIPSVTKSHLKQEMNGTNFPQRAMIANNMITKLDHSPGSRANDKQSPIAATYNILPKKNENKFVEPCTATRKRLRSRECDDISSPVPAKRMLENRSATPTQSSTPDSKVSQTSTPGSARKVIMGLERGLNRVRHVLTPKRRVKNENSDPDEPNVLSGKGLSNVSATCSGCPKHVLSKLRRALRQKGIMCRQKGFILQGETEESSPVDRKDSAKSVSSQNVCSFELEVCFLEIGPSGKRLVGIRRKRLKGDAWVYKRVCEEILALTAEDISTDSEVPSESKCPI